jgi:hypothetical protein
MNNHLLDWTLLCSATKLLQVSLGLQSSVSVLSCSNWDTYCKCHLLYNYMPAAESTSSWYLCSSGILHSAEWELPLCSVFYCRTAQISPTSQQKPEITLQTPLDITQHRVGITTLCCVISQNSTDLIYITLEAWKTCTSQKMEPLHILPMSLFSQIHISSFDCTTPMDNICLKLSKPTVPGVTESRL